MRITNALRVAIQTYYFNRSRASTHKWDKQADLEKIDAASGKFHFEAAAGSFWFSYRTTKNRIVLYTSEKLFPEFEKTSNPL